MLAALGVPFGQGWLWDAVAPEEFAERWAAATTAQVASTVPVLA